MSDYRVLIGDAEATIAHEGSVDLQEIPQFIDGLKAQLEELLAALKDTTARAAETGAEINRQRSEREHWYNSCQTACDQRDNAKTERDKWRNLARDAIGFVPTNPHDLRAKHWFAKFRELEG